MFFNWINLDTKYGCGHFGSRFQLRRSLFWPFPALFFFVPPYCQTGLVYSMTKRTASAAFPAMPPTDPVPTALSVFVALSPTQFHQLETDQPVIHDPFSERFGLRTDRLKALERAYYFTNWTPPQQAPDSSLPIQQKQFVLCKLLITPLGYDSLWRRNSGQRRWTWSLSQRLLPMVRTIVQETLDLRRHKRNTSVGHWRRIWNDQLKENFSYHLFFFASQAAADL